MRSRIYDCQYWKEHCFGLTAETLLDKAVDLRAVGGTFGARLRHGPEALRCMLCVHRCTTARHVAIAEDNAGVWCR